jgi:hypothetical protein
MSVLERVVEVGVAVRDRALDLILIAGTSYFLWIRLILWLRDRSAFGEWCRQQAIFGGLVFLVTMILTFSSPRRCHATPRGSSLVSASCEAGRQ